MVFNSFGFLIFYPIVLLFHFLSPIKYRWVPLLAASVYFYISWNYELFYLITFTTIVSFVAGLILEKSDNKAIRKLCLVVTLVTCLGILFFFKYFNFLSVSTTSVLNLFGLGFDEFTMNIILPVGISFYTFQTLSYVIDVYRGDIEAEHHFGYYALFVTFFPQLVAGPIIRPQDLLPQLKVKQYVNPNDFAQGSWIMMIGYFKKLVVADLCAPYVNNVYNNVADANGLSIVIATLLFAVQIYCDFSGYTDIAIGCARVMGLDITRNFNRPYTATSIKDFWARWHISLSTWFRDYLYIPLGGNRVSIPRYLFNIFTVFMVSGLWHGASWTFVIWGALHGIYQVVGYLMKKKKDQMYAFLKIDQKSAPVQTMRRVITFTLVCFAWIFFRANSADDLVILLGKLFTEWGTGYAFVADTFKSMDFSVLAVGITIVSIFIMDKLETRTDRLLPVVVYNEENGKKSFAKTLNSYIQPMKFAIPVWILIIAWLIILSGNTESSFIYFQF